MRLDAYRVLRRKLRPSSSRASCHRAGGHRTAGAGWGVDGASGGTAAKLDGFSTSFADRLAMVKLAVAGDPAIVASGIDAPRSDGEPNYSIDVLPRIKAYLPSGTSCSFSWARTHFYRSNSGMAPLSFRSSVTLSSLAGQVSRSMMCLRRCPRRPAQSESLTTTAAPIS